jgi:hypothetical protein
LAIYGNRRQITKVSLETSKGDGKKRRNKREIKERNKSLPEGRILKEEVRLG